MRLIDADAFIQRLRQASEGEDEATREYAAEIHDLVEIEATFYPVDAEPIRHGKWKHIKAYKGADFYQCSICGDAWWFTTNYCANCGAKME